MSKIAVFPGTFDPVTIGHVDIVNRASELFDEIIIAVGVNTKKTTLFDLQLRKEWIQTAFSNNPKVRVESYEGLTVDFCKKMNARFLLRGLRNGSDFDYESHIAQLNKALWNEIETVFIMCDPAMSYVSSTLIRDLIIHKADYQRYLPEGVNPNY
ncbi:MAG: pantetheine-phosphate adenylyltransferase [Bacteroidetes bacterium]|nr:pantetheine-phosphate adenylyltransferase [Bacteroidota bacterium]